MCHVEKQSYGKQMQSSKKEAKCNSPSDRYSYRPDRASAASLKLDKKRFRFALSFD